MNTTRLQAASNGNRPRRGTGPTRKVEIGWQEAARFPVPIPKQEKKRLSALRGYQVLDSPPEENFDGITTLAAQLCGAPIALLSLVDSERQWFKSKVGLTLCETSRNLAFCAHAIMQRDVFIVEDAALDPRFASNPMVTSAPRIRFYAGAPLVTPEGMVLGTLCVIDRVPRKLTGEQIEALRALSRQAMAELTLRRDLLEARHQLMAQRLAQRNLRRALQTAETTAAAHQHRADTARHRIRSAAQSILSITGQGKCLKLDRRQQACLESIRSAAGSLLALTDELDQR